MISTVDCTADFSFSVSRNLSNSNCGTRLGFVLKGCVTVYSRCQELLDDEAVLDAIDEENEFQALVVSVFIEATYVVEFMFGFEL